MSTVLDPMESAVADAELASQFFGKLEVDAQFVVLRKGERKRAWVEGESTDGRTTEVTIRLNPLDITGMTRMVERSIISNSGEWSRVVWPSLRDLGVKSLREINGRWAHVTMVPSGRSWTNNQGETVQGTTFKFIKLFDLESDAEKEWESQFGGSQPSSNGAAQPQAQPAANDAERAVAAQFLPALVKAANGDLTALAANLASFDLTKKYFDVNSPEVQALLKAA